MWISEGTATLPASALKLSLVEGAGWHEEDFASASVPEASIAKVSIVKVPRLLLQPRARVSPKPALVRCQNDGSRKEVMSREDKPARQGILFRRLHQLLSRQKRRRY